jgi:menaquinone-dependent protoporphyrinogen IX oxidase
MNTLIVYYSRSGRTRKIANQSGLKIKSDIEEIKDKKNRSGIFGFINSGNEAHLKKTIPIDELEKDPSQYETVIIGTPIWANTLSTPIRSFLKEYQQKLKRVAFFCTSMGSDPKPVFLAMEKLAAQKPITVINITARDIKRMFHLEMVDKFVQDIKQANK